MENPLLVPKESVSDIKMDSIHSDEQKQQSLEIGKEYEDVLTDIHGRTSLIEHSFVLNSETPIYKRPYTMPQAVPQKLTCLMQV